MTTTIFDHAATGWKIHIRENTSDRGVIGDILDDKVYRFDPAFVPDGGVILDVGANIGLFSLYAAKLCPSARVIAYEPEPDNFRLLSDNFAANGFAGRIAVWPKAISNKRGTTAIWSKQGNSRVQETGVTQLSGEWATCETVTLEDALAENRIDTVDFLKMDVEWSEYMILDVPPEVMRRLKRIALEYHPVPAGQFEDFLNRLRVTHDIEVFGAPTVTGYIYAKLRD
jgi:FkbM family methyltransferase